MPHITEEVWGTFNDEVLISSKWPEKYDITEDEDGESTIGVAELLLRKNRNGPTGKVKLKFVERFAKFVDKNYIDSSESITLKSKSNIKKLDSDNSDPF